MNATKEDFMPGLTSLLSAGEKTNFMLEKAVRFENAGGKRALILDSTQLVTFDTCPTAWKYSTLEQLETVPKVDQLFSDKRPLIMGTYGHKLLEIYYKMRSRGLSQSSATEAAMAYDPDSVCTCNHHKDQHANKHEDFSPCLQASCECTDYAKGEDFDLNQVDRAAIKDRFILYTYTYANNDIIANSEDSVEIGFSSKIFEDDSWLYILEGRIDIIGNLAGQQIWGDHKFQLRRHSLYKKSIQFKNYALATGMTLGFVNYVRMTKEISKDTFSRDILSFSSAELSNWRGELLKMFHRVAGAVSIGEYDQHWSSCSGIYGYPCIFTELCEELNPHVREAKKSQLYQIRKPWSPW